MSKKLISVLVLVLTLTLFTMGGVFAAAAPTPVVKVNGTTLNSNEQYKIVENQTVNVTANGASKVLYKIGNETTKIVSGSSTNITIPTSYTNTGVLTVNVCSVSSDNTQGQWYPYYFSVTKNTNVTAPTPVVKVNGTTLNSNEQYKIVENQTINVAANGASKIMYKIGNETTKIVSGSSTNITIPTSYTNTGVLTVNVCSVSSDNTQGQWYAYYFSVVKNTNVTAPTPVVKVQGVTLNANDQCKIVENQMINITANGASKIMYKIGNETTKTVSSSSANITIPTSYTNTGYLTVNICSISSDNTQGQWYTYYFSVVKNTNVTAPTPIVKVNGGTLNENISYTITQGQTINITANGASKIMYKIGNETTKTISGSSTSFTIPRTYTNTSNVVLNVCSFASDGTQGQWYTYYFDVRSDSGSSSPYATVKISNAELTPNYSYVIEQGQVIQISTNNASKIYYKIGNESMITANSSYVSFTIPTKYTGQGEIALSVCAQSSDGTQSAWKTYYLDVRKDSNTVDGSVTVKVNGRVLNTDTTYTIEEGQQINIQVPNANRIYYKISNSYMESIVGTSGTITIPTKYTNTGIITLSVSGVLYDGTQTNWKVYYFEIDEDSYINPNITVKIGNTTLRDNTTYVIEEGQEIDIYANNANKIVYQIGNSSKVTVNSLNTTIRIPSKYTNAGMIELRVATINSAGTQTAWRTYEIEVRDGINNSTYPLIILEDEKMNNNVKGLNVSLRTVPLTTKTGNMNYFLLNEYIQYNIDFVNASKNLTDKVYIDFVIPSGFEVEFVDIKGATKINDNTLRWTFDGMQKGEKGTIPVTLYYTEYPSKSNLVKPYAKIKSGTTTDVSAVINLIAKNASTEVTTKHTKFMLGDADTNTFRPNEGMNRAEVAMLLTRILDIRMATNYTVTYKDKEDFKDPQYAWATQAIMTVTKYGLMEGYEDGTFRPGAKVTKAQLITILSRAFALEDEDTTNSAFEIKDEPIKLFNNLNVIYSSYGYSEHWATKYLAQMIRLNILPEFANTVDGNLDLIITRAEAAKLICTVLYRGPAVDITRNERLTNEFKDVTERTAYYEYILEATADNHNSIYQKNGWEKITD